MAKELRPDREGAHRQAYARNRKRILATQNTCGICGKHVDLSLKNGDPMAPTVDHIIPVAKGGHPSSLDNLQLAHWTCNRQKSDKIFKTNKEKQPTVIGNRNLPQSMDWRSYRSD
jgi:5-methylcytosine-specific restriction endonuclease McrA